MHLYLYLTVKRGQPKPASFCMSAYNDRQTTIVGAVICPGGVIPEVIKIGLIGEDILAWCSMSALCNEALFWTAYSGNVKTNYIHE